MDSYFLASKKIEAHLLTSIFHSEYSNPAKKTPSCKLLGRQQLGMQSAVLEYNSTAKISGAVLDYNSTAKIYLETVRAIQASQDRNIIKQKGVSTIYQKSDWSHC